MKIQLIDMSKDMCRAWETEFKNCKDVVVHNGDFFSLKTDCVVSPANSFGFMLGSLDYVITKRLGTQVQERLQKTLQKKYFGELLVGQAELIDTSVPEIPFCISAPTMRISMSINGTANVYLATKAIFFLLKSESRIKTITISGLGTGVGQVPFDVCAKQMKKAYDEVWLGNAKFPKSLAEACDNHYDLIES